MFQTLPGLSTGFDDGKANLGEEKCLKFQTLPGLSTGFDKGENIPIYVRMASFKPFQGFLPVLTRILTIRLSSA